MEKGQLNFNQPLLSVRRGSPMDVQPEVNHRKPQRSKPTLPPLPYYKPELKSGPIRNPGVVPFQWEQMPGRPKDRNIASNNNIHQLSFAPKLPPGRIATQKTMKDSPDSSSRSLDMSSTNKGLSVKDTNEKDNYSSDDESVTFVDTSGTLSRVESLYNCSVSGVSGMDDPNTACSGMFSDAQTQDFMMGRFLPAAKAVPSETPHFASRKHSSTEKSEPVTRVIKWKKQSPQYTLPHSIHGQEEDDDEEELKDDYGEVEGVSVRLCGLLPKFCLLNPIPGMRDHAQATSSVRSVRSRRPRIESSMKSEIKDRVDSYTGEPKRFPYQDFKTSKPDLQTHGGAKLMELFGNPAIEKTLYMNSEHMEQSRNSISSSSESRGRNPSVDSLQGIKSLTDEKLLPLTKSSDTSSSVVSTPEKSFQDAEENLQLDQDFNLVVDVVQQKKPGVREVMQESSRLALTPFLPKSPSESWLYRTLPSMYGKNVSSKSYLESFAFKSSPVNPKRTSMLRTPNLQPMVFRPVGELAPILEN